MQTRRCDIVFHNLCLHDLREDQDVGFYKGKLRFLFLDDVCSPTFRFNDTWRKVFKLRKGESGDRYE